MFNRDNHQLPSAQLAVMRVLWDKTVALSAKQIVSKLQEGTNWSGSTIRTHLRRLVARGYLKETICNGDLCYSVVIDEQTYLKQATSGFLTKHYKNSIFCMVSTFADGRLSKEELQELKKIMSKLEE